LKKLVTSLLETLLIEAIILLRHLNIYYV